MELIVEGNEKLVRIRILGPLASEQALALRDCLAELWLSGRRQVRMDFSDSPMIDTLGIGILAGARERLRQEGGDLILVNLSSNIAQIFRLMGLESAFTIVEEKGPWPPLNELDVD